MPLAGSRRLVVVEAHVDGERCLADEILDVASRVIDRIGIDNEERIDGTIGEIGFQRPQRPVMRVGGGVDGIDIGDRCAQAIVDPRSKRMDFRALSAACQDQCAAAMLL